jgi:hypothetical protein
VSSYSLPTMAAENPHARRAGQPRRRLRFRPTFPPDEAPSPSALHPSLPPSQAPSPSVLHPSLPPGKAPSPSALHPSLPPGKAPRSGYRKFHQQKQPETRLSESNIVSPFSQYKPNAGVSSPFATICTNTHLVHVPIRQTF